MIVWPKSQGTKGGSTYVFIDASNLWEAQKAKGKMLNYEKLLRFLESKFHSPIKVFFYTAYPAEGTRSYDLSGKHKFYTYLSKGLGFEVRKKPLKRIHVTSSIGQSPVQSIEEKGNMDVELTIDAMYHMDKFETAVFFTGDSDFLGLITHLRQQGKKAYVFSSKNNISQELRTGSDAYCDILLLTDDIWGTPLRYRDEKGA